MKYLIQLTVAAVLFNFKLTTSNKTLITIAIYKQPNVSYSIISSHAKQAVADFKKTNNDIEIKLSEVNISQDENVCSLVNNSNVDLAIDFSNLLPTLKAIPLVKMAVANYDYEMINDNECKTIQPPSETMVYVIRYIVNILKLNTTAVIYDETFAETMSTKFVTLLTNLPTRQIILPIQSSIKSQLLKLQELDINNIFVAANSKNIKVILDKANENKMLGKSFTWYLLTKDLEEPKLPQTIPAFIFMKPSKQTIVLNEENLNVKDQELSEIDKLFIYKVVRFGLREVYLKKTNTKKNETTDFTLHKNVLYDDINIDLILINNTRRALRETKVGIWRKFQTSSPTFNNVSKTTLLPIKHYRIVTTHQPPFVYRIENSEGVTYDGYCVDLINELKTTNHFTYDIYDLQEKNSTIKPSSEQLIEEIHSKRADIVLAALFAGMDERHAEYTIPFYDLIGMKMIIKKPAPETSLFRFLTVMEPLVWVSILVAYLVTSILLWIIDKFSPFSYQNNQTEMAEEHEKRIFTLKESFWFCVTSLTPQGSGDAPKSVSGRLLAATWWLFGFVFIASYTANLAAFLTVSRLDTNIDSLDSLANQYLVKYSTIKNSTAMKYFEKMAAIEEDFFGKWKEMTLGSTDEIEKEKYSVWNYPVGNKYTKMWRYMSDIKFLDSLEEGLEKIRKLPNGFVLIADTIEVSYILSTNCDLTTVGDEFSRRPVGLAVSKSSDLKEKLSIGILKMQNARTLEILKEKWWQNNPYQVHCEEDQYTEGISLRNIGGIFVVIVAGIGLSWIILLLEFLWNKTVPRSIRKKNVDSFKVLKRTIITVKPTEDEKSLRNRLSNTRHRPNISHDNNYAYTIRSDYNT
ncbi:hypothetical protein CHUAL_009348 [Chamberlinius hualienensis]